MQTTNYRKDLKQLYHASSQHAGLIRVPEMQFLMIDGEGDPNTSQYFQAAMEALFSLSYTLKFMIKRGGQQIDYKVLPLEGLWWTDDMANFSEEDKDDWQWTVMIMQPEYVTPVLVDEAREQVKQKKDPVALSQVRFESYTEGQSAQIMHIGPFSEEGPTIEKLHRFIREQGLDLRGKHHEIYLSDIRRAAPENWKTILRQPVM